jgi:hypothetical protein
MTPQHSAVSNQRSALASEYCLTTLGDGLIADG